jgi:hypothetical protein
MQIERTRGDTYADRFLVKVKGIVANLTGCVVTMTVNSERNPTDTTTQAYQLIGVVDDPSSGYVDFIPSAANVDRIGVYYFDIQLVDSNGVIRTLVKDAYNFTQDITK